MPPYPTPGPAHDEVSAWKPRIPGIAEVFHARFRHYGYPSHTHSTWALVLIDEGGIRYDLDKHPRASDVGHVTILPPHVVHDGRAATDGGFRKRVLYLDEAVLAEGLIGRTVDQPTIADAVLRENVSAVHRLLRHPDETLHAESRLAAALHRMRRHLRDPMPAGAAAEPQRRRGELAEEFLAYLEAHVTESVTLAAAAESLRASPAHLVRSFTGRFGLAPHAYLLSRKIDIARARVLDGYPLSSVATGVGFYDQAHFTRHFKRYVGTTPGRFAREARRFAD
jgi:AraC-like DNA-binding protein